MQKWLLSLLLVGVCLFVGCGGSSGSGPTPPPTTPTLTAITVTPANPAIALGTTQPTQQFAATGTYSDGSTKVLTSTANWVSSNPAVATVNTTGLATGMTAGTTTIGATSGTISGSTVLTVNPAPLVSIAVTPATASVIPNGVQQFTATGTYADHSTQNITDSVAWSASVGATINPVGLATAGATPGTSTIMAAQGNISGTATLTITNPLVSIAVTPLTASIAQQTTQQFVATGTYADHSTQVLTTSVTWNSSNTTIATISNSQGTQGLASSLTTAGTTMITATMGTVTSPAATLTVTSATLVSIAVTPVAPAIVYQTTQPFVATGTYSDSSTQVITNSVTWASSDTTKITITVSGVATGVNTTTTAVTISATKNTIVGSTTATVIPPSVQSIVITPAAPTSLAMGTSRQYTATATLANGSTRNVTSASGVNWSSSDVTIATVGATTGVVKAATPVPNPSNPVTITVSYSGVNQSVTLDVTNATVSTITVTPITPSIPAGVQQRFIATAIFSDSTTQDISQNATWNSSNTGIATVNSAGIALGVSPGPAAITANFESVTGTAQLTVSTATLQSIAVTPSSTVLAPASTLTYQAVGTYSDQTTQFLSNVTWVSSAPTIVSITAGGVATGQSAGTANITATYQGITSNMAAVLVTSFPLSTITVSPSAGQVPEGVALQFTALGTFANSQTENLTSNVTWASSQPSIATVSNATGQQGLAEGVTAGTASISADFAGIVGSANLNVTTATLVSIAITPANSHAPVGTTVSFDAKGTFSDQSVVDLSTQVTWSSSVPAVATINSAGLANTAGTGQTTITATFSNGMYGTTTLTVP